MSTTPELIEYIQKKHQQNTPEETIREKLSRAGWNTEDIDSGFLESSKSATETHGEKTLPAQDIKDLETLFTPLKIIEHDVSGIHQKKHKKYSSSLWWIMIFVILLVFIVGAVFVYIYPETIGEIRTFIASVL